MSTAPIRLSEVDEARITILMDNSIDLLLPSTDVVRRFERTSNWYDRPLPRAEHGFSALIGVKHNGKEGAVLLDTGASLDGVLHNFVALQIDPAQIHAIVLSHGHFDHTVGLHGIVERIGNPNLKIILHPDANLQRKAVFPNGKEIPVSIPPGMNMRLDDVEIIENTGPTTLLDDTILVTGEIPRTTGFEKGFPIHYTKRGEHWEHDPLIMDDQCVILNVKGKGLVIVTGCGHSGIINTIRYARQLTGIQEVCAVIGGFHLTGGLFEKIIPDTIAELAKISPRYLMPGHCTGWSALRRINEALPDAFIVSSVGTTLVL